MSRLILPVVAFLSMACTGLVLRDWPYNHECPIYECFNGTSFIGCKDGYSCQKIYCGNICVPLHGPARDLDGQAKSMRARRCKAVTCDHTCPYGFIVGADGCLTCDCIIVG